MMQDMLSRPAHPEHVCCPMRGCCCQCLTMQYPVMAESLLLAANRLPAAATSLNK